MTGPGADGGPVPGLELEIPPKPAFVRTARHAVAALARLAGAPEDLVEDIKLAVSEACNTAVAGPERGVDSSRKPLTVTASVNDSRIEIEVLDPNGKVTRDVTGSPTDIDTEDLPFDRILALPIVRGLVDDVSITQDPQGARMRMVVTVASSAEGLPSG
jgi:anti-sigma regulatory factor (Ser/Thr protein kinase)